jgi:stage II sporulation protein M
MNKPFWDYIADKPTYIKMLKQVTALFFACLVVGIIASLVFAGLAQHLIHSSQTTSSLAVVTKVAEKTGPVGEFLSLLFNNFLVCLLAIIMPYAIQRKWGRFLIYGPLMSLGLLTGAVLLVVTSQHGLLFAGASLIPHGIFEMSAYFLSAAYGLVVFKVSDTPGAGPLGDAWKYGIKKLLYLVVPLVLVASLVEVFITPILMTIAL